MKNKKLFFLVLLLTSMLFACVENSKIVDEIKKPESTSINKIYTQKPEKSYKKNSQTDSDIKIKEEKTYKFSLSDLPKYSQKPYVAVNNNIPCFDEEEITNVSFESYSKKDNFGRCGVCIASIGKDIMPTEERGAIGSVKPTGWHSIKYDNVDGKYLYNRCHLIGFQLTGENANEENLITGTRYMNVEGMLPFENMVADYVKETNNHVMYRATPVFEGDNLLASGVLLEGYSVEDNGEGICFYVFCYNVQPGIVIDYSNGESYFDENNENKSTFHESILSEDSNKEQENTQSKYILNTNTKKFHYPHCKSIKSMKEKNKQASDKSHEELVWEGYFPCGNCNP